MICALALSVLLAAAWGAPAQAASATQEGITFEVITTTNVTHVGGTVLFQVRVDNQSAFDFTEVEVTSNLPDLDPDLSSLPDTMGPGEQELQDFEYAVQPADVPIIDASFTLTGRIDRGEFGGVVDINIPLNLSVDVAALTVVKKVNGVDDVEIALGTPVDYSIEVINSGGADLLDVVVDDLDLGISESLGNLPMGSSSTVDLPGHVHDAADFAAGPFVNTAVVEACYLYDEFGNCVGLLIGSDTATVALKLPPPPPPSRPRTPRVDLVVQKLVDDPTPAEGQEVTFTITVTNQGPDDAEGVVVSDVLPSGLTYAGHSASRGTYDAATGRWNVGDLADDASATLTLRATVDPGTAGRTLTNTARLTDSTPTDRDSSNNEASASVTPPSPPPPPPPSESDVEEQPPAPAALPVTGGSAVPLVVSGLIALGIGLALRRRGT